MITTQIKLKGLAPEQVERLLPEGLISLCWRGSVAHGMYVPKSDPDSIDDKDVMGIYIGSLEHYLGFGRAGCVRAVGRRVGLRLLRTTEVHWSPAQLQPKCPESAMAKAKRHHFTKPQSARSCVSIAISSSRRRLITRSRATLTLSSRK